MSTQTPPNKKRHRTSKAALGAALAVAALGAGVFASFTDTETATRSVAAGQLDIMVSPEVLSVAEMAPGDWMSRGLAIDIDADNNNGNLIEVISLDVEGSISDLCVEVNAGSPTGPGGDPYVCEDDGAHLMDGNALDMAILACPNGGQIFDANPTDDDDGDPSTDPRMDGPGPYTCVVDGDEVPFLIVEANALRSSADPLWQGDMGYQAWLSPYNTGAMSVDIERPEVDEWSDPDGSTHQEFFPVETFADGQTLEMVTCISMPSDIGDRRTGTDKDDNDYENLTADVNLNWTAHQRAGEAQTIGDGPGSGDTYPLGLAWDCDQGTWTDGDDTPGDPGDPFDPDSFFEGDNTIHGVTFFDATLGSETGLYDPEDYSPVLDVEILLYADGHFLEPIAEVWPHGEDGSFRFEDLIDGRYLVATLKHPSALLYPTSPTGSVPDDRNNDFGSGGPAGAFTSVFVDVEDGQVIQVDAGFAGGQF